MQDIISCSNSLFNICGEIIKETDRRHYITNSKNLPPISFGFSLVTDEQMNGFIIPWQYTHKRRCLLMKILANEFKYYTPQN
jgi:hypothetical protein